MDLNLNEPFLNYKEDVERNEEIEKEIMEKVREGCVWKVYGILSYQIIITSLVVFFALINSSFQEYLLTSHTIYGLCCLISLICLLLPLCSSKIYQSFPTNYIVMTIFTLSYSWIIAAFTCLYTFNSVMTALFLTLVTVVTLTIYAWKTKKDYSISGGALIVSLVLLIFSSIIFAFIGVPFFNMLITYLSLILFSVYLIYDTQLLCGKGRVKFSEDDYILAAINIYLDIVILFTKILSIFGEKK